MKDDPTAASVVTCTQHKEQKVWKKNWLSSPPWVSQSPMWCVSGGLSKVTFLKDFQGTKPGIKSSSQRSQDTAHPTAPDRELLKGHFLKPFERNFASLLNRTPSYLGR